jgi:uncharacterized protein (DUF1697 family)
MRFAAFFRTLTLGRAGSPDRAGLVAALAAAGASEVAAFRAHGNAAFSAGGIGAARRIADAAGAHLRATCGWDQPVFVRSMEYLEKLVAAEPFAEAPPGAIHERCVTFLPGRTGTLPPLPIAGARGDFEVFAVRGGEAFSVTRLVGGRPGNVTGHLERLLGTRLTSRNWNTVALLVQRHG